MRRFILIIILLGMSTHTFPQERPFLFKVDYPDYVPKNNSFEISVMTRTIDPDCYDVHFYLLVDNYVDLKNALYIDDLISKKIDFKESDFYDFYGKAYKVDIHLDSLGLTHDIFYQIILEMEAYNYSDIKIAFGYECFYHNGDMKVFSSYDFLSTANPLPIVPISFFDPQLKAGKSISLKPNSFVNLNIEEAEESEKILVEFWSKIRNKNFPFFNIINKNNSESLLSLFVNQNQIISCQSDLALYFKDFFVGGHAWAHFSILISNTEKEISVYGNDVLFIKIPFSDEVSLNELSFNFKNEGGRKNMDLDLLKVWEFDNSIQLSFFNKHYKSYIADSSKLFINLDFDDEEVLMNIPSNSNLNAEYNNITYTISDAPVFSKAPELEVVIYGGFYSVEWEQREISFAEEFSLERSYSQGEFENIYTIYAEDDLSRKYFYSDERRKNDEIVYYRLKQLNKDGSYVYSSTVKIGQVKQLTFNLEQNFPNPFNPETQITIEMLEQDEVEIYVYDLVGKKIEKLHEGSLSQGRHTFNFNASNLPSGIYFFEAKTPSSSLVRKMILTK